MKIFWEDRLHAVCKYPIVGNKQRMTAVCPSVYTCVSVGDGSSLPILDAGMEMYSFNHKLGVYIASDAGFGPSRLDSHGAYACRA